MSSSSSATTTNLATLDELIQNPPINTKKYLNQYTKMVKDPGGYGVTVRSLGKNVIPGGYEALEAFENDDDNEFRIILIHPKTMQALGGIYFKKRSKGGKEIGLASVDEKLRGTGIATKLLLLAMKKHPEVKFWTSGTLVSEKGLAMFKRLYDTGKVDMWFVLSPSQMTKQKVLKNPPEEFWKNWFATKKKMDAETWKKHTKSAYGSARKELFYALKGTVGK